MRTLIFTSLLIFALSSCASKKEKQKITQEVAQEKSIKSPEDLQAVQESLLAANKGLNNEQKERLKELIERNYRETKDIQNEIDKTKTVLFKELLSSSASKSKIRILENQLLRLNRKKTRYSLSAFREAKEIVGKNEAPLEKTLNMLDNRSIHEF